MSRRVMEVVTVTVGVQEPSPLLLKAGEDGDAASVAEADEGAKDAGTDAASEILNASLEEVATPVPEKPTKRVRDAIYHH